MERFKKSLYLALLFSLASTLNALTLQDIRTQARRIFNETNASNSHCSETELNSWANIWQRDIGALSDFPRKESTISTTVDVDTYTLPTDFRYIMEVHYNQSLAGGEIKLEQVSQLDLERIYGREWRQDTSTDPAHFFFYDFNKIGVHPAPNAANAGAAKLRLFYVASPTDMTADGDSPDVALAYHDTAQYFVAAHCFVKMGNDGMAEKMLALYDRMRLMYKSRGEVRSSRTGTADEFPVGGNGGQ